MTNSVPASDMTMTPEAFYISDDGIRLSAVLEYPEEKTTSLVIILHGFGSTKDRPHNIQAAKAMREAGCATLRFDLYGHGESGGEFRKHTLFKWISNTLTVIDWARENGFKRIYLSGHSQGGLAAALTAGMEHDRIKGLILRAPAFLIPECARKGNMLGNSFDPNHIPDIAVALNGLSLDGNYARTAQMIHVEDAFRFTGPVLILHGAEDDIVPLDDSRKASEQYMDCELKVMTGETHHFNRHPEQMMQLLKDWIVMRDRKWDGADL